MTARPHRSTMAPMSNKIPSRPGLEVFVNEGGTISIKQEEHDEDSIVVVHPGDVDRLVELLQVAKAEALEVEGEIDPSASYSAHAERTRSS